MPAGTGGGSFTETDKHAVPEDPSRHRRRHKQCRRAQVGAHTETPGTHMWYGFRVSLFEWELSLPRAPYATWPL